MLSKLSGRDRGTPNPSAPIDFWIGRSRDCTGFGILANSFPDAPCSGHVVLGRRRFVRRREPLEAYPAALASRSGSTPTTTAMPSPTALRIDGDPTPVSNSTLAQGSRLSDARDTTSCPSPNIGVCVDEECRRMSALVANDAYFGEDRVRGWGSLWWQVEGNPLRRHLVPGAKIRGRTPWQPVALHMGEAEEKGVGGNERMK